jgi:hypothetical protein
MIKTNSLMWILAGALLATLVVGPAGQCQTAGQTPQTSGPTLEERHPRYALQREDVVLLTFPSYARDESNRYRAAGWLH